MLKHALSNAQLLRYILGSAMVGGAARGAYHLLNSKSDGQPWKEEDDTYDPEIELPVGMSAEEMAEYKRLKGGKTAGAFDNTKKLVGIAGGGIGGWIILSRMIEAQRKKRLDAELENARRELDELAAPEPATSSLKAAAAWDWLDIMASRYTQSLPRMIDEASEGLKKEAWARGLALGHAALDLGKKGLGVVKRNPAESVAIGGTAGLAASSAIPGLDKLVGAAGTGVSAIGGGAAKFLATPVGSALAATLGPIAAMSLLLGIYKGYGEAKGLPQRVVENKALRKKIREEESKKTPYFKLRPYIKDDEPAVPKRRAPTEAGLITTFTDAQDKSE